MCQERFRGTDLTTARLAWYPLAGDSPENDSQRRTDRHSASCSQLTLPSSRPETTRGTGNPSLLLGSSLGAHLRHEHQRPLARSPLKKKKKTPEVKNQGKNETNCSTGTCYVPQSQVPRLNTRGAHRCPRGQRSRCVSLDSTPSPQP